MTMTNSQISLDQPNGDSAAPSRQLLLSIPQAAEVLCISRTTLYQLMWRGELTPIRIGRSVRFAPEQLREFVSKRVAEAA
jgi:excisionase family DNA binding protein